MLRDAKAVAFISTTDTERARHFYGTVLGLKLSQDPFALVARIGDAMVRITTLPGFKAGQHPVFGFAVDDIAASAQKLAAHGVALIRYDFLGDAQGPDGIWTGPDGTKVAWFNDPDGNLLSLTGRPAA